jgi:SpoU rRNA methylase family enzyme
MTAAVAKDVAGAAARSGVAKIAEGANEMGKGQALEATGEALEERAER